MLDLKNRTAQYFVLFMLAVTWGSSFILMKLGLRAFAPHEVALIRLSASFIVLVPFVVYHFKSVPRAQWKWLAAAGWLGNGIPAFMFAIGLSKIDSSLGGIINSTAPIFTLIVGMLFFGLVFTRNAWIGVTIGLAGTVYLILFAGRGGGESDYRYAFFPLIGSLCYGFSTNIIKKKLKDIKPIMVTGGALSFVGPITWFFLFQQGVVAKIGESPLHTSSFLYAVLLGVMGTSLAVLVFNYLIKHTTVLFAASVTYLIPVFAMFIGFMAGEAITIHYFVGMAVIIFGVWLTNRS